VEFLENTMTNLSFFTKYPTQGATSRYRSFAFALRLAQMDYNIEIQSFMDSGYLSHLFNNKPKSKRGIFYSYCERFFAVVRSSENLIIERELFPFLPYWFEAFLLSKKRYILDFDDNVWEDYREKFWLKNKYDKLVKNASGVIVGNDYLEKYVKNINPNVIKIPTVVNIETYQQHEIEKFDRFSVVWIGSPITYRYIESFSKIFQALSETIEYDLIIVAAKHLESRAIDGVSMKFYDWSCEIEIELLKQSHIGIMPLDNDPFSLGKSGFKLILYQAAGLPSVASPIGENCTIIKEGINGFLPKTQSEWLEAITQLCQSSDLRAQYGLNASKKAYDFSMQKYFTIYRDFIDTTFKTKEKPL
jgi:glycosyltransferase involved in cell wall biosynthesis